MNERLRKFCEICQIKVEEDAIFHLLTNNHKLKLLDFLPQIDLHLTPSSVICDQCSTQITDMQEFKQLKVEDEGNTNQLLQQDLPSKNNFKEPDANFMKVLGNDNTVCVKEEPGVEKIKEELNVGLINEEVCNLQVINYYFLVDINNEKLPEIYYCHVCGCCTDTEGKLIEHIHKQHKKKDLMGIHTNEKIYQRDKCNYKSSFSSSWRYHNLTHIEKPFKCTECNYETHWSQGLKAHMCRHTGKYPFQCDKCNYKAFYKNNLKMHILSQHTSEKPYHCDRCEYKCAYKARLKKHILSHILKKPYQCDKCDYKCRYKSSLKKHTLSQHTGEN